MFLHMMYLLIHVLTATMVYILHHIIKNRLLTGTPMLVKLIPVSETVACIRFMIYDIYLYRHWLEKSEYD